MPSNRIHALDIFRGLTIFTMVFVNDLAGVANIPQWMKHMPADADAMTFVDVVFPAFLFIVGMAIPYAVKARQAKGESWVEIWKHVIFRTVGLLVLGVYMVNSEEMNAEASLIGKSWWDLLMYGSAILTWNRYPKTDNPQRKRTYTALKIVGVLVLIVLYFLFRKGPEDQLTGMTPSWWGILGLIGWAYLFSMIVFYFFKQNLTAIMGMLGLFIIITVGLKSEGIAFPGFLAWLPSQAGNFAHASLTLAGIILSLVLMNNEKMEKASAKISWMLVFGLMLLIAGYFLRPLYGISKIYATPTWTLYCAAICCFLFPFIYWLVDMKSISKWANFLTPAGKNPLLTYILPGIFYAIFSFSYLPAKFNMGFLGIFRSILFALFILWISSLLSKLKINLHL